MHQKTCHNDKHIMSHIPECPPEMASHFGRFDGHDRFVAKPSKPVAKRKGSAAEGTKIKSVCRPSAKRQCWFGMYFDEDGEFHVEVSPMFQSLASSLEQQFGPSVRQIYRSNSTRHQRSRHNRQPQSEDVFQVGESFDERTWGSNVSFPPFVEDSIQEAQYPPRSHQSANAARETAPLYSIDPPSGMASSMTQVWSANVPMATHSVSTTKTVAIKVCETEKWEKWFDNAFKAIQQQACRFIAKEWIKLIHPKKQSTHPYNGNFPRQMTSCPERTKPPYWHPEIQHKEPDHIDKDSRVSLLVHILMHTPQAEVTPGSVEGAPSGKEFRAKDLLESLRKKDNESKFKWAIIEEIIYAREQLESFKEGGCDADMMVHVGEYCEPFSPDGKKLRQKVRRKQKKESNDDDGIDHADSFTRPASPTGSTATELMSDYEDDKATLAASFTSCGTQPTPNMTRSSRVILRPKQEADASDMYCINHESGMQPTPNTSFSYNHDNDFSRRGQPSVPAPPMWPPTVSHDGQFDAHYQMNMMASQVPARVAVSNAFDHNIYSSQLPAFTNADMSMMGYQTSGNVNYEHIPEIMKVVPYCTAPNTVHDAHSDQGYALHAHYANPYGSRQ